MNVGSFVRKLNNRPVNLFSPLIRISIKPLTLKYLLFSLGLILVFGACKQHSGPIVSATYVDSLLSNYTTPAAIKTNETEMQFWKSRITGKNDIVNGSKYASLLVGRFNLLGDIQDVKAADSISDEIARSFNGKEASPYLSIVNHSILQHRFKKADEYLGIARAIGLKQYESAAASFDVDFELGRMELARADLEKIHAENDYGYQFRKSKMMHYKGDLDSSINAMQTAVKLSGSDPGLKQAALSNVGDLYIHAGKLEKAYDCYIQSIRINAADLHSIMGIGWIALVNDKNDSLAERIFSFVHTRTQSPEPVFKLEQAADLRPDSVLQKKYADEFVMLATDSSYGSMYNKYLLQLYTGILNEPAKALNLAKNELENRATPQTYAWYVWSLLANNKKDTAYAVYQQYVSGKPLEGLELYWMGKLMQSMNKGYNAQQYFREAIKNRYDLSPGIVRDLDKAMEEK